MDPAHNKVLDEVRHLLNCPVCYQQYEHPRRLSCEHVFCSPCLKKLLYEGVIKCPECRLQTTLLPPTINSLPSCIIIQRFIEGLSKNNNICDNDKCMSNTSNGNLNGELVDNVERPNDRKLDKLKNSIRLKYQPTIDHLKEKKRSIEDNLNSVRNSINYFTHELTKEIQTRRSQLMEEVTCYERRWLKPLECQIDGLEMEVHEQISFALFQEDVFSKTGELISEVDTRSPVDLPDVRDAFECGRLSLSDTGMLQQLREQISLLGTINEDRNQNYMPSISSAPRDDFAKEITSVFNNQSNLPCNFGPQGMCVERNGVLMVVDSWNRMCHEVTPTNLIRSFSLTDDDGDRSSANLYDVTSIDHGRKLIFSNISSPILKTFDHTFNKTTSIDLHIPSSFQLQPSPFGLARDRRDYIYVADKRNRVIQVREQSGKLVRQFPCNGIPRYIDIWNDILVVSDSGNKCCYIYSVDGRLLSTIDQKSGVHFEMPMGVAFHEKGFIFAADYLKKCVCAFRISGQLCFEVDLSGYKINPEGITVHRNTVYISDRLNSTVIKINLTEFLTI